MSDHKEAQVELKNARDLCSKPKLLDTGSLSSDIKKLIDKLHKTKKTCQKSAPLQQLYIKELAYWRSLSVEGEAIPPIVKPLLDLLQLLCRAYMCRIRLRCVHETKALPSSVTTQSQTKQRGGRGDKPKEKKKENNSLEKAWWDWTTFIRISDDLIEACEASRSSSTLTKVVYETACSHLLVIEALEEAASSETPTQSSQQQVLESLEQFLKRKEGTLQSHSSWPSFLKSLEETKRRVLGLPFYQSVSEAEKKAVFLAMGKDVGTAVGSYGGHWYYCPNGHIYTIGECGGAMQESTCNECGARIGGGQHRVRDDNRSAISFVNQMGGPY
jgi:hypothetical protein